MTLPIPLVHGSERSNAGETLGQERGSGKTATKKGHKCFRRKVSRGLFSFGEAAKKERGALLFFLTGRAEDAIL